MFDLFSDHPMYVLVNTYLLQRPVMDLKEVPLFYTMFNSSSMQVRISVGLLPASLSIFLLACLSACLCVSDYLVCLFGQVNMQLVV